MPIPRIGNFSASLPQNLGPTASPTFAGLTLSSFTEKSVLFAGPGGVISQDNANFSYSNGALNLSNGITQVNGSGTFVIAGQNGSSSAGFGISLFGGDGNGGAADGGGIGFFGGFGGGLNSKGGDVTFQGGFGGSTGAGGDVYFVAGTPNSGNAGNLIFQAQAGAGGSNSQYRFTKSGSSTVYDILNFDNLTAVRTSTWPDATGTVPLLDIGVGGGSPNTSVATSGNGFSLATSTLTTGNLVSLSSTGTAAASNSQIVLNIATSGANATANQVTYGLKAVNTHSGTGTTTNVAGYFSALAATGSSFDLGLVVENGMVVIGAPPTTSLLGAVYGTNGVLIAGTGGTGSIALYDATTAAGLDFYAAGVNAGQFKINTTDAYFWAKGSRNFIVYLGGSLYQGLTVLNNGNVGVGNIGSPSALFSVAEKQLIDSNGVTTKYKNVTTAAWGIPAIYGSSRSTAQTGAVTSVTTYTVGSADGSFYISSNVNVTAYTAGTINVLCDYTDETNTARTFTFTFTNLTGTLVNAIGATGPFESFVPRIRCKASTQIKIYTTVTVFTGTYNVEGDITQIA